jgi:hypothetical protein
MSAECQYFSALSSAQRTAYRRGGVNPCAAECDSWLQLINRPTFNPCISISGWQDRMAAIDAARSQPVYVQPTIDPVRTVANPVPAIPTQLDVPRAPSIPFMPIAIPPSGPATVTPSMPPQAVMPSQAEGWVSVGGPRLEDLSLIAGGSNLPFNPPNNAVTPTTTTVQPATVKKEPNLLPIALGVFVLKLLF